MKKIFAAFLALVLMFSMAVSAFAALSLDVIVLEEADDEDTELIELETIVLDDEDVTLVANEGGVYYVVIEDVDSYKNLEVAGSGIVSAALIEWDPEVYDSIGETYSVIDKEGEAVESYTGLSYAEATEAAEDLNNFEKVTYYKVACEQELVIVELTVSDNYSASYKEGTLKVTATEKSTGKDVAGKWVIISDVTIFEYEEVKYSAKNGEALVVGELGYSDYETAENGYGDDYDSSALRTVENAAVISTTAFRAIKGEDITVAADENNYVTIYDVAADQKGVNFSLYGYNKIYDSSDEFVGYEFGFYGDQVIASDFEIVLQPGITYYELREEFGVKIEEDDIVDFYLLKDGKVVQIITVDFMTVDLAEEVEITIEGSNSTLGQYELRLEVETEADSNSGSDEENPNTGAESAVGVVAALAVVSAFAAAAVSFKK